MSSYITIFELFALLASLAAWGQIRSSPYLRIYPLLLLLVAGVETYTTYFKTHRVSNAWIYNWQVPVQHLLYLLILYFALEKPSSRRLMLYFMAALVLLAGISWALLTEKGRFNAIGYCCGSIFVVIGIILKFYEMLQNPTDFNFLRTPFFYLLFAFLLFSVGSLPYFSMGNWLYFVIGYKAAVLVLINVMSILNYVLYGTYTMVFIWIILRKGYS
jgi:hypothetical protein